MTPKNPKLALHRPKAMGESLAKKERRTKEQGENGPKAVFKLLGMMDSGLFIRKE
jgi:hypothetical protein